MVTTHASSTCVPNARDLRTVHWQAHLVATSAAASRSRPDTVDTNDACCFSATERRKEPSPDPLSGDCSRAPGLGWLPPRAFFAAASSPMTPRRAACARGVGPGPCVSARTRGVHQAWQQSEVACALGGTDLCLIGCGADERRQAAAARVHLRRLQRLLLRAGALCFRQLCHHAAAGCSARFGGQVRLCIETSTDAHLACV
jgi:hypothetical protein